MRKAYQFMLQFLFVNIGTVLAFAALVIVGSLATGVPAGAVNIFSTYYRMFPMMTLLMFFLFSFGLCTSNLNLALSFGARRKDFFLGLQVIFLTYTAVAWVLQLILSAIPSLIDWVEEDGLLSVLAMGGLPLWLYPLLVLAILALGCLSGLIFTRSKVWGIIIIVASMLVTMFGTILLMIIPHAFLWGGLPLILTGCMLALLVVCEGLIWRTIRRFMVR